jgi:chemotaxis protein CheY-P-specific phosphatase CheC
MRNELVATAWQASAQALSILLHEPIEIVNIQASCAVLPESCYIFTTEVQGDWQASSWLACTQEQMNSVWQARQGANSPTEASLLMQIAFMSELDNIVCAHFVTSIDQATHTKAFGGTPAHFIWRSRQVLPTHREVWSCTLKGMKSSIELEFIWFLS